jgi:hypothetical protein
MGMSSPQLLAVQYIRCLVVHSSCTTSRCSFISGNRRYSTSSIAIALLRPQQGGKVRVHNNYITSLRSPASRTDLAQRLPETQCGRRMSAISLIVLNPLSPRCSRCHSKLSIALQPYLCCIFFIVFLVVFIHTLALLFVLIAVVGILIDFVYSGRFSRAFACLLVI